MNRDGAPELSSPHPAGATARAKKGAIGAIIALAIGLGVAFLTSSMREDDEHDGTTPTIDESLSAKNAKSPGGHTREARAEERRIIKEWGDLESRRLWVFGGDGRLLPEAIKTLKLTPQEQASLHDAITRLRQKTAEDFLSRTRLEEKEEKEDGTHYHFYTRARRDRGRDLLDPLSQEIGQILGPERAKAMMRGLEDLELPGDGGKVDMQIEVIRQGESTRVKYRTINASTGERGGGGESGSLKPLERSFGENFKLPLDP